jgi:hypothetical protein
MKTEPNDPINPTIIKVATNYTDKTAVAMLPEFENKTLPGLTKREYFAALSLQGLLSASGSTFSSDNLAALAIICTDKLIDKLNDN